MHLRKLSHEDYYKGYLDLLEQLTTVDKHIINYEKFKSFVNDLNDNHIVIVLEDEKNNKIVGSGTILIEQKLIHGCSSVGHIEDIVIDSNYGGKNLGKTIVNELISHAKNMGCYKIILDCAESVSGFYEKCGFKIKEKQMVIYF